MEREAKILIKSRAIEAAHLRVLSTTITDITNTVIARQSNELGGSTDVCSVAKKMYENGVLCVARKYTTSEESAQYVKGLAVSNKLTIVNGELELKIPINTSRAK